MGLGVIPNTDNHFFQYNELDDLGNVIGEYSYSVDSVDATSTYLEPQLSLRIEDDLYIASLIAVYSPFRSYGTLFKFNLVTQEMELLELYDEMQGNQLHIIEQKNDSSLLLGTYFTGENNTASVSLYETGLEGEIRWSYVSDCGFACRGFPEQILSLTNGNTVYVVRERFLPAFLS